MLSFQQEQEESEFSVFDNFDYHTDDDWVDFPEQSFSFQFFQNDEKHSPDVAPDSMNCNDSFLLNVNQAPVEVAQIQQPELNQKKQDIKKGKKPKTKIILTPSAEQFRRRLYRLLSNGEKKIVRKEYVFLFHSLVSEKHPNIRDVHRDEYRSIGNYFNAFSSQQNSILQAMRELKEKGFPEINYNFSPLTSIRKY